MRKIVRGVPVGRYFRPAWLAGLTVLAWVVGCDSGSQNLPPRSPAPARPAAADAAPRSAAGPREATLELVLLYGSEKKPWIDAVTADFNAGGYRTDAGQRIEVRAWPWAPVR